MLGMLQPNHGSVSIFGQKLVDNRSAILRETAFIPETVSLYPQLSGLENLSYFAELAEGKKVNTTRAHTVLAQVGLSEGDFNQPASSYSKGMRQKICLALAFYRQAKLLILDEPTSGLDPRSANDFLELIRSTRSQNQTVFMVTHDIFRAKSIADRIGIMHDGKMIRELSTPDMSAQEIESVYLEYFNG